MNDEPTEPATDAATEVAADAATPASAADDDPWDPTPEGGGMGETTRHALTGLAIVALATGLFIVVVSAMDAFSTWLQPRWVPVAQTAFGLVLVVGSVVALGWLVRQDDA